MFYNIKRGMVWLQRIRHSRGFGVQSPWAYHFIIDVIYGHFPQTRYKELERQVFGLGQVQRKLCRLYLRIANHLQPQTIVDYGSTTTAYRNYFKAGCHDAEVHILRPGLPVEECQGVIDAISTVDVARFSLRGNYREFLDTAIEKANPKSLFIIQHIHHNRSTRRFWKEIQKDSRVGVTFDLYYCGLLFFDKKMYKQHDIVNF